VSDDPREQQLEPRSSVKLTLNAKHDPQWEIKVLEGATTAEIERIRRIAVDQHNALMAQLLGRGLTP
jgi:hypothetical protein